MNSRLIIMTLAALAGGAQAQRYELIDLGSEFEGRDTYGLGTNASGDRFVGSRSGDIIVDPDFNETDLESLGVEWNRLGAIAEYEAYQHPLSVRTWAFDINDRGQVGGIAETICGGFLGCKSHRPFQSNAEDAPDVFNPFDSVFMTSTQNGSMPSVNEQGYAVGFAESDLTDPPVTCVDCVGQPIATMVAWIGPMDDAVEPHTFEALDGKFAWSNGLNEVNEVVGGSRTNAGKNHAFFGNDNSGKISDLGTLGGDASEAEDINDDSVIVGWARTAESQDHAFRMDGPGGQMEDLGTLGGRTSRATSINNDGVIVGHSWTSDGEVHAFVAVDGQMRDLNELTSGRGEFLLTHAEDISESGVIVGWGMFDGLPRAFALEPVDCAADLTGDGELDADDFFLYLDLFASGDSRADFEGDGDIDAEDFFLFLDAFAGGCG